MKLSNLISLICITTFGLIAWEHGARISHLEWRPSVGLTYLANQSIKFFTQIGKILATISSFYTWINLDEFYQTLQDLFDPTIRLLSSPVYTIKGYLSVIVDYQYPILIVLGSMTLCAFLLFLVGKYFGINYKRELDSFLSTKQSNHQVRNYTYVLDDSS
jgi:hypothetical protein